MNVPLVDYLGKLASDILESPPFREWTFERSIDDDLPERIINYVSEEKEFSFVCDEDEQVQTIFLENESLGSSLTDVSFSSSRSEVIRRFGRPSKSGEARVHKILGEYGAWDRYDRSEYSIHIEYHPHTDRIKRITLMRAEVVP